MYSKFVYVIAVLSSLGGFLFGYDTGVISGAILFIKGEFHLTTIEQEWVIAILLLGAFVGAGCAGFLTDRFGRKKIIIVASILFVIGALMMISAGGLTLLLWGRLIIGLAIGLASLAVPLYVSEMSPPSIRGFCVSMNQMLITVGILVAYGVDLAFAKSEAWRWMVGLSLVPAVTLFIAMFFLPETPRWLVKMGRKREGRQVLKLIGMSGDLVVQIEKNLRTQEGGWRELFNVRLRMPLIVGMLLALFQQITGINTVIYYAPTIFEKAGFGSATASLVATTLVGVTNVLFTIFSLLLLDRVGRRPLLIGGILGMIAGLGALGCFFYFPNLPQWIAVGSLMLYIAGFAIGLGTVAWLFIAEIYPLRIRGAAMSFGTGINWASNFLVALTFLTLLQAIGASATFWLYAGIGILTWCFAYFFIPETKGKSLEEIETFWLRKKRTTPQKKIS